MKHFKVEGVCVYYDTFIVKEFDNSLIARAFFRTIPDNIDVDDISNKPELQLLKQLIIDFVPPKRMYFTTKAMNALYSGYYDYPTGDFAVMELFHHTSSTWERDRGFHERALCIFVPTCHVLGVGTVSEIKQQIKLLIDEEFRHTGNGIFVSDKHSKFTIRSFNKIADTPEDAQRARKTQEKKVKE